MSIHDEDLQKKLDAGQVPDGEEFDVKAYQKIYRALERDPAYTLSGNFADNVVSKVMTGRRITDSRDYFWFAAGIFFLLIAFVATVIFTGFRFDFGFLESMREYKGLALFGVAFIAFLHWLDKRMIKTRRVQY